jgi:hypothetical protein
VQSQRVPYEVGKNVDQKHRRFEMRKMIGSKGKGRGARRKNIGRPMTPDAAGRIQSAADKNDSNQDFKSRAQRAAEKNGGEK